VAPADLGATITHEHLLIDFSVVYLEPADSAGREKSEEKLGLGNLGWIRFNWVGNKDNLVLDDEAIAITEASHYAAAGGGTIVDVTTVGIGRNPEALVRISEATGLNVVMGAGFYIEAAQDPGFANRSVDDLTRQIVREISEGVDGTGIRAGIIGEIGCSWPWTSAEQRSVSAAVAAQIETGAPILIHPGRDDRAPLAILEYIDRRGGDMSRTIMGHIERTIFDPKILAETAATGAYLEYDLFGHDSPYYPLAATTHMPGDHERIEQIGCLLADGYEDRLVLAHDVCSKHRLKTYGGHGWDHIVARVVPWMKARGIEDKQIESMLVTNPARVLIFS
jgi:phosphotriesterase-related protein